MMRIEFTQVTHIINALNQFLKTTLRISNHLPQFSLLYHSTSQLTVYSELTFKHLLEVHIQTSYCRSHITFNPQVCFSCSTSCSNLAFIPQVCSSHSTLCSYLVFIAHVHSSHSKFTFISYSHISRTKLKLNSQQIQKC